MSDITWTDEALAQLHIGRGVGEPSGKKLPTAAACWKALRQNYMPRRDRWTREFQGQPSEIACVKAAHDLLMTPKAPTSLLPMQQGWLFRMAAPVAPSYSGNQKKSRADKVVTFWVRTEGYAFAVKALVMMWTSKQYGDSKLVRAEPGTLPLTYNDWETNTVAVGFRVLRALLAGASDEDYTEARDAAAALREAASPKLRCGLAYLFPTESIWCNLEANALFVAERPRIAWHYALLGSLTDADRVTRLLSTESDRGIMERSIASLVPTMVMRLGAKAAAPLRVLLVSNGHRNISEAAARGLMLLRTPEAIRALLDGVKSHHRWLPAVKAYAADNHALVLPELKSRPEGGVRDTLLNHVLAIHPEDSGDSAPEAELPECLRGPPSQEILSHPFWAPGALPDVRLAGSEVTLSASALANLMAQLTKLDGKSSAWKSVGKAGSFVEPLRQQLNQDDLRALTWAFFEKWVAAYAHKTSAWALFAIAPFADDDTLTALVPYLQKWPGKGWYAHSVKGLEVLRVAGTDGALMHLQRLSEKAKSKGLRGAAASTLQRIATARGLSGDQLGDRLVPTVGLAADGTKLLDYGPRKFIVGFDENLKPFVTDEKGKRRASLPKPGVKDDAALAGPAYEDWKALKKAVRAAASLQIARQERFMIEGRRWPAAEFRAFLLGHPLLAHLVRRLIWGTYSKAGALVSTFRVNEAGETLTPGDEPFALADNARVGVAHPVHLARADIDAWSGVLADYEIVQPFQQLDRPVIAAKSDAAKSIVASVDGAEVPNGRLRGLLSRGWERGPVEDAGWFYSLRRRLPSGTATLKMVDGGLQISGSQYEEPSSRLGPMTLPKKLDPVIASELLLQLQSLIG